MLDFFNKLFKPVPPSGATAKERLRLVLLSDHLSLAPDVIEALKRDLLVVISKYVEIDQAHADVTFEQREGEVAMLASIPITGVRERRREEPPQAPPAAPGVEDSSIAEASASQATVASVLEPEPALSTASEAATLEPSAAQATTPPAPRRRRRRKGSAAKRAAAQQTMALGKPAQA